MNLTKRHYYHKFSNAKLIILNNGIDLSKLQKDALLCLESTDLKWSKQNNDDDELTAFIYDADNYKQLTDFICEKLQNNPELKNYAKHRWLNRISSNTSEDLFCSYNIVRKEPNSKKHGVDFYICGIPFDLKVTTYPFGLKHIPINEAKSRKNEVIHWLYDNQSRGQRFHVGNRLFIMTLTKNKLQASIKKFEFDKIRSAIDIYLNQVIANLRSNEIPFNVVELNIKDTPKTKNSPGGDFHGNVFADIIFLD